MQRILTSLLFCAAASIASAQGQDYYPEETAAMRASVEKHVTQVDAAVKLNQDQRAKVAAAYMHVEMELAAVNHRFDQSNYTPDERAREMNAQWQAMEKALDFQLKDALTGTQYEKWAELAK